MRAVGLELSGAEVRAVHGELRRGRWTILETDTQPLPTEPAARQAALKAFGEAHALRGTLIIGLPLTAGAIRVLSLPPAGEDNLARMARAEAESHFGIAPENLSFGWAVADSTANGEAHVVVAVARRDEIRARLAALGDLRLTPRTVTFRPVALANLLAARVRASGQAAAVLHLAADGGELLVLDRQGRLAQVRAVAADPSALWSEVDRSAQSHAAASGETVSQVLVCGPEAHALPSVAESADFRAELVDPWAEIGVAAPESAGPATAWAGALGLLLQAGEVPLPVDLRRRLPSAADQQRKRLAPAGWAIAAVLVALVLGIGWFAWSYQARQQRLAAVTAEVEQLKQDLDLAGGESTAFLSTLQTHQEQVQRDSAWLEILRQFAERLPTGVALEQLNGDITRGVTITGQARGPAAVTSIILLLNESGRFDPARLDSYDALTIGDQTIYNFQVSAAPLKAPTRTASLATGSVRP